MKIIFPALLSILLLPGLAGAAEKPAKVQRNRYGVPWTTIEPAVASRLCLKERPGGTFKYRLGFPGECAAVTSPERIVKLVDTVLERVKNKNLLEALNGAAPSTKNAAAKNKNLQLESGMDPQLAWLILPALNRLLEKRDEYCEHCPALPPPRKIALAALLRHAALHLWPVESPPDGQGSKTIGYELWLGANNQAHLPDFDPALARLAYVVTANADTFIKLSQARLDQLLSLPDFANGDKNKFQEKLLLVQRHWVRLIADDFLMQRALCLALNDKLDDAPSAAQKAPEDVIDISLAQALNIQVAGCPE